MPFKRSLLTSAFLLLSVVRLDAQIVVVPVKNLTAGTEHTCALLNDGSAKCWGNGASGQLANGKGGNFNTIGSVAGEMGDNLAAIDIGTGKTAVQLVTGRYHNCAVLNDGSAKCWGRGSKGQLGYGNADNIGDGEKYLFNN